MSLTSLLMQRMLKRSPPAGQAPGQPAGSSGTDARRGRAAGRRRTAPVVQVARAIVDMFVMRAALITVGELRRVFVIARFAWKNGRRPWFAAMMAAGAVAVYVLLHNSVVAPWLWRAGDVTAALPLSTELWRLPLSLFVPTAFLPLWAAVGQLLVVLGLGEILLGRWVTVVVAALGHAVATLTARAMIEVCSGNLFCLPAGLAHAVDTGPSAAVTAVGACLLVTARCYRSAAVLSGALLIAAIAAPGLDGQEHLLALACGLIAGALCRRRSAVFVASLRPGDPGWGGVRPRRHKPPIATAPESARTAPNRSSDTVPVMPEAAPSGAPGQ
jgi:hypothetical protein